MVQHLAPRLAGQSEYEVRPRRNPRRRCPTDGIFRCRLGVPPVDALQRPVERALHAVFDKDEAAASQRDEVFQQLVGHTIRPGADDQPHHARAGERLLVLPLQLLQLAIRAGISLEIGEILHRGVFAREEPHALLQLLADALVRPAILRAKRLIITICASAEALRPVAVGARKPRVDGNLLDLPREPCAEEVAEIGVAFRCHGGQR